MRRWLVLTLITCIGCGDPGSDERPDVVEAPPGPAQMTDLSEVDDVAVGPCKHELKRECKVTLNVRNGIRTCAVGEQRCEGGQWGECKSKREKADRSAGAAGAESQ